MRYLLLLHEEKCCETGSRRTVYTADCCMQSSLEFWGSPQSGTARHTL